MKIGFLWMILLHVLLLPVETLGQKSLVVRTGLMLNNQLAGKFGTNGLESGPSLSFGLINDFHPILGSGVELNVVERKAGYTRDSLKYSDQNLYIDLGVSVRCRKEWDRGSVYLTGGMLFSFWQGGKRSVDSTFETSVNYLSYPTARSALDVGMYLGAGAEFAKFMVELRTLQGLVDISNDAYDPKALYNQGIQITLGYRFGLE